MALILIAVENVVDFYTQTKQNLKVIDSSDPSFKQVDYVVYKQLPSFTWFHKLTC